MTPRKIVQEILAFAGFLLMCGSAAFILTLISYGG